jgi:hypothetical protein
MQYQHWRLAVGRQLVCSWQLERTWLEDIAEHFTSLLAELLDICRHALINIVDLELRELCRLVKIDPRHLHALDTASIVSNSLRCIDDTARSEFSVGRCVAHVHSSC